jgi:hypothetical protein
VPFYIELLVYPEFMDVAGVLVEATKPGHSAGDSEGLLKLICDRWSN